MIHTLIQLGKCQLILTLSCCRTLSVASDAACCNLTLFLQALMILKLSLELSMMCMQQAVSSIVRGLGELLAAAFLSSVLNISEH